MTHDTTPPPDDIAGLRKRLRRWFAYENCGPVGPMRDDFKDADAAIERLARGYATLAALSDRLDVSRIAQQARIVELEVERDRLEAELRVVYKLPVTMQHPVAQKLVAERDAIRAKTIEQCATWLGRKEQWRMLADDMRRAMRAGGNEERQEK